VSRSQLDRQGTGGGVGRGRAEGSWLSGDDSGCTVLHVDMDAFYASVELIDRPHLRGRPVIVGAGGGRGVVLSATYEARRAGVHSAMPMSRARRLCPAAEVISPDHRRYSQVSAGVMEIFRSVTPAVEPLSLDEAFLGVSGAMRRLGSPTQIAQLVRERVLTEQRITCSVGVAATKFVAKLASSRCKPDGLLVVPADESVAYLHPLPVSALWGVGERTAEHLHRLGLLTVGDIAHTPEVTLRRALGESAGRHLYELAWARDPRPVLPSEREKSIGAEETFGADVDDPEVVLRELLRLSDRTARRLRGAGAVGRTVVLKVRFSDFTTITRSRTLRDATDLAKEVYDCVASLWEALHLERARIRLVGVRVEGLLPADEQHRQLLLDQRPQGWSEAERATDKAVARFGDLSVRPATLLGGRDERHPARSQAGDTPGTKRPRRAPTPRDGPGTGASPEPFT
jgi:DNA polymerase-4